MSKRPARRGLVVGLVALIAALAGPVEPVSAAASTITVLNQTSPTRTRTDLSVGDVVTIHVCFQGTVARAGGTSDADVKLVLNSLAAGVAWGGTTASFAPGTNNCLVFPYTVASSDTAVALATGLKATQITLSNSATLTITGFTTLNTSPVAISAGAQGICNGATCGAPSTALSVLQDVTAPTATLTTGSSTPADNDTGVLSTSNLVLGLSERVFSGIGATQKACSGNVRTVTVDRNHDVTVGDIIKVSQVGPGYDSASSGASTYFRVSAVAGSHFLC